MLIEAIGPVFGQGPPHFYSTTWVVLGIASEAVGIAVQVVGIAEQAGDIGERVAGILVGRQQLLELELNRKLVGQSA